jgi:hypothetical protein
MKSRLVPLIREEARLSLVDVVIGPRVVETP